MKVISVNIGKRVQVSWNNKTVETGIFKHPVAHPILLEKERVHNDIIADPKVHGGIDKAVYAFGLNHYAYYQDIYPDLKWSHGMFGENLTLEYLEETELHIDAIYQLGQSVVQVSKPRQPCFKLGIRFENQAVLKTMWNSTKTGAYFKVIEPGFVQVGDTLTCIDKGPCTQSIADIFLTKRSKK